MTNGRVKKNLKSYEIKGVLLYFIAGNPAFQRFHIEVKNWDKGLLHSVVDPIQHPASFRLYNFGLDGAAKSAPKGVTELITKQPVEAMREILSTQSIITPQLVGPPFTFVRLGISGVAGVDQESANLCQIPLKS